MVECKNCQTVLDGNFCPECGQSRFVDRLRFKEIIVNAVDLLFNVDKGLIVTIKGLTLHPGTVVSDYIEGKRIKYFNPLKFLVLFVAVNTLFTLNISEYGAKAKIIDIPGEYPHELGVLLTDYWDVLSLLTVPVFSLFSFLLFREYRFNFTEHLVINAYIIGYQALLGSLFYVGYFIFCPECYLGIYPAVTGFLFFIWGYMNLFKQRPALTVIKLFLTFFLATTGWGLLLYFLIVIIA